jgi:hypothetical protein
MSENRQTNAAPENGFAPSTTSNACFVFLRYWPGFSEHFPYGEFERISDEEIDDRLWVALQSELERRKVHRDVVERIRDDCQGFPGAEFMNLAEFVGWSDGLYHMEESARPRLCSRKVCIGVTTTSDEAEALMNTLRHQAVIENSAYDSWSDPESAWDDASLCNPRFFCVSASKLSPSGQVQARISIAQLQSGVARDNVEKRATKFVQLVDSFHEQWQQVNPAEVEPADSGTKDRARMSWQEAAERMERLRQQGEQFTSQPKLAKQFGCSSGTINKAIHNTPALRTWAMVDAIPKAQSINAVVTDTKPQERELGPEDEAAIREFIETADSETRAWFLALPPADQIAYLNDPDANPIAEDGTTKGKGRLHKRILGRKP